MLYDKSLTSRHSGDSGVGGTITPQPRGNASQRATAAHSGITAANGFADSLRSSLRPFYNDEISRTKKKTAPRCRICGEPMTSDEIVLDEKGASCEACANLLCISNSH